MRDYDPTVKVLVETSPSDWPVLDGRPRAPVTNISDEVTAVLSAVADCFLRVEAAEPYVLHLDFQSGHDSAALPPRLDLYITVASYRTGLPVRSIAVLLSPEADSPQLTGRWRRRLPGERSFYRIFRYGVLRIWEQPPERFLTGGAGTVPLAAIGAVSRTELPRVIQQIERRLQGEPDSRELWEATRILLGLRYSADTIAVLLRRIREMKESSTYQATLAEGRVEEARRILLLLGQRAYGPAEDAILQTLDTIGDAQRLEELALRVAETSNWYELLGLRRPRRRVRPKTS